MGTGVAFGTATSGVITAASIPAASIANSGTAAWARIATSAAAGVFDFSVTATGGGGDILLSTVTLTTGVTLTITSFTLTEE
jgi:hypothetical protein